MTGEGAGLDDWGPAKKAGPRNARRRLTAPEGRRRRRRPTMRLEPSCGQRFLPALVPAIERGSSRALGPPPTLLRGRKPRRPRRAGPRRTRALRFPRSAGRLEVTRRPWLRAMELRWRRCPARPSRAPNPAPSRARLRTDALRPGHGVQGDGRHAAPCRALRRWRVLRCQKTAYRGP
jgi:hypothetical protein